MSRASNRLARLEEHREGLRARRELRDENDEIYEEIMEEMGATPEGREALEGLDLALAASGGDIKTAIREDTDAVDDWVGAFFEADTLVRERRESEVTDGS